MKPTARPWKVCGKLWTTTAPRRGFTVPQGILVAQFQKEEDAAAGIRAVNLEPKVRELVDLLWKEFHLQYNFTALDAPLRFMSQRDIEKWRLVKSIKAELEAGNAKD